jgi:hypothetical protein
MAPWITAARLKKAVRAKKKIRYSLFKGPKIRKQKGSQISGCVHSRTKRKEFACLRQETDVKQAKQEHRQIDRKCFDVEYVLAVLPGRRKPETRGTVVTKLFSVVHSV